MPEARSRLRGWVLGLGMALAGCGPGADEAQPAPAPPLLHRLAVQPVESPALPLLYPAPGTVVARERLEVASRVTGFIRRVPVDEGEVVEAGQVLVELDDAAVEAAARGAEASLVSARADLEDARGDVDRYRQLAETQALAEDALRDARVRLARAEATVAQAAAELAARLEDRRHTRIVSPSGARVRERLRHPGDLVTPGAPILRLEVLATLELEVFLPASRIDAVVPGLAVPVEVESAPGTIAGRVASVVRSADPATRRCKVRVALPGDSGLMPGQFARAVFSLGARPVPAVPARAVTERAGIPGVFVVDAAGTARFRSVQLGRAVGEHRELLAGVEPGTPVVVDPPASLADGHRVAASTDGR
jgi:RND family efflux transporter MFP subunit